MKRPASLLALVLAAVMGAGGATAGLVRGKIAYDLR